MRAFAEMPPRTTILSKPRVLAALAAATALSAAGLAASDRVQPVDANVAADRAAATRAREAVRAESRRIAATRQGLAEAERRLAALTARESRRRAQFVEAQDALVSERIRLTRLEKRSGEARDTLAANLVAAYEEGSPDLMTIVVNADGFRQAIEQVEFERRVHLQNRNLLRETQEARRDALRQEARLEADEKKFRALALAAAEDRNQANAVRSALARREAAQLRRRSGNQARLAQLQRRITSYEREQVAGMRAAAGDSSATAQAPKVTDGSAVARVVAAANQIATTPYVWGGGHGGRSGGYDCSGSISYALAAGGLLDAPRTSGGFMNWGLPGEGQRITVYANAGHAYMVVDGRRFDTTALRSGGTRWTNQMRSSAGFVARHPPGF